MRLFKVKPTGEFSEFKEHLFEDGYREETLESWLEQNSQSIVEDGALLIIGRQVATNLGCFIDLLALDKEGNTAIIELKRGKTPRDVIAQALEYSSWVETLEYSELEQILRDYQKEENLNLSEYHKAFFKLEDTEGVSFNKDQRVVVVGYQISQPVRETAMFLRKKGLRTTCVEFNYFKSDAREQLMTVEIVVGKEPIMKGPIKTESRPTTTKEQFLQHIDGNALPVFTAIFELAEANSLHLRWGAFGFSLCSNVEDMLIPFLQGYPNSAAFGQVIYTYSSAVTKKVENGIELFEWFKDELMKTMLFEKTKVELKYTIQKKPSREKIEELTSIIQEFLNRLSKHGLLQ